MSMVADKPLVSIIVSFEIQDCSSPHYGNSLDFAKTNETCAWTPNRVFVAMIVLKSQGLCYAMLCYAMLCYAMLC